MNDNVMKWTEMKWISEWMNEWNKGKEMKWIEIKLNWMNEWNEMKWNEMKRNEIKVIKGPPFIFCYLDWLAPIFFEDFQNSSLQEGGGAI